MKPSFKTTTLIAAIGMIVYALYVVARYIIHTIHPVSYHFDLWEDICVRMIFDILPISLILACLALYKQRPVMSASKPFRMLTIGLFVALIGTVVLSWPYTVRTVGGMACLFPSISWRVLMLMVGIVWLFMLRQQPTEETSSRSYRVTLIITICALALPIMLEMASGLSFMTNGHILCLSSSAIKSWVRWIAPTLPLTHFVFPQIKTINTTRNNHCVPGSFDESTFNRNL